MASFAEIDENNIVLRVVKVPDSEEHRGQEFLADELGLGGRWIQTSFSGKFRKNFAGIGFTYDEEHDMFIPPQPYPSWYLDINDGQWKPPIPYPTDEYWFDVNLNEGGKVPHMYLWDEGHQMWIKVF